MSLEDSANLDRLFSGGAPRFFPLELLCAPLSGELLPPQLSRDRHAETWAVPMLQALERFLEREASWPQPPEAAAAGAGGGGDGGGTGSGEYGARDPYVELRGRSFRNARRVRDAVLALAQPSLHCIHRAAGGGGGNSGGAGGAGGLPGGLAGQSPEVAERIIGVLSACERVPAPSAASAASFPNYLPPIGPEDDTPRAVAGRELRDLFPVEALQVPIDAVLLHPRHPRVQLAAWGLLTSYIRLLMERSASADRYLKAETALLRNRWTFWAPKAADRAAESLENCFFPPETSVASSPGAPAAAAAAVTGRTGGRSGDGDAAAEGAAACAGELASALLCAETLSQYAAGGFGVVLNADLQDAWQRALRRLRNALRRAEDSAGPSGGGERLSRAIGDLDGLLAAASRRAT